MIHTDGIPTIANRKARMAQFPDPANTVVKQTHVHEWPEHLHKSHEPCTKACPEAVCECGAKLVVVEPGPEYVNCYNGVTGHRGAMRGGCHNKVEKGSEPPYCSDCQKTFALEDALESLKGTIIREIELGHYPAVRVHWSAEGGIVGGVLELFAEHDERFGDDFVTWSLA